MAIGTSWRPRWLAAALALTLAVACGAGPQLTRANFEQVRDGMTRAQVEGLLGKPTGVTTRALPVLGTVTTYEYKNEKADVELHFRDDRLKVKIGSVRE